MENKYNLIQYFQKRITNITNRAVGINQYCFPIKSSVMFNRENVHYFSKQFKIVIENIEKQQNTKLNTKQIHNLFKENKSKLTDLTWVILGYY
jgi:hypothetical protein